jgi:hypothetical protein
MNICRIMIFFLHVRIRENEIQIDFIRRSPNLLN